MTLKLFYGSQEPDHLLQTILMHISQQRTEDLNQADYIIFPNHLGSGEISHEMAHKIAEYKFLSEDYNKRLLLFVVADYTDRFVNFKNAIIYKTSMYKSERLPYERILPYLWVEDKQKVFEPILNQKPKIGFCGALTHPQRIQDLAFISTYCNQFIDCEFIIRDKTWGEGIENSKNEFMENMQKCEFVACPRGCGNFSIRFYEALSVGRIPVFTDTDMLLPFENEINWHELAVISQKADQLPLRLQEFISTRNLVDVQKKCRSVYNQFLTLEAFSKHLNRCMVSGVF